VPARPRTVEEVRDRISSLLDQPKFAASRWGVLILNERGEEVFSRDADKAFTPASNMKLYTSSAALDAFGLPSPLKRSVRAKAVEREFDAAGRSCSLWKG
jgi:D-alanyl-D-alanine carboxypeptidase/D-alanyl-D-alanine-endopeptidase (penicillin-binding protein 4)